MRVSGGWTLMASAACALAALFVVAALSRPETAAGPCTMIGDAAMLHDVPEASGLAVSRRHPGLLWTHNDSGNETVLFAVGASGEARGRVRVPSRTRDWEDLSFGPCSPFDTARGTSGDCLYIADIGDNDVARRNVQVLRVPEPEPTAARTARPETFTLTYPDGPHNAEALFVIGGTVFIVTKDRSGMIYRSARTLVEPGEVQLQRVGNLGLTGVTDAETSRDGQSVVVRTSHEVVMYRTADLVGGQDHADLTRSAPQARPTASDRNIQPMMRIPIDGLREAQGEGVALDGDTLYLASEAHAWSRAGRLLSLRCSLPSLPLP